MSIQNSSIRFAQQPQQRVNKQFNGNQNIQFSGQLKNVTFGSGTFVSDLWQEGIVGKAALAFIAASTGFFSYLVVDEVHDNLQAKSYATSCEASETPSGFEDCVIAGFEYDNNPHIREFAVTNISKLNISDAEKVQFYVKTLREDDFGAYETSRDAIRDYLSLSHDDLELHHALRDLLLHSPDLYKHTTKRYDNDCNCYKKSTSTKRYAYSDRFNELEKQINEMLAQRLPSISEVTD